MSAVDLPRSPNVSAALAKIVVGLSFVTTTLVTAFWIYMAALPDDPFGARYIVLEKYRGIRLFVNLASKYLFVAAAAAHLLWVGRALAFARRTGADVAAPLRAVGAYFVPLAQFVYPYRHMQALVGSTSPPRSHREEAGADLVEQPYRASARLVPRADPLRRSALVVAWWSAWVGWVAGRLAASLLATVFPLNIVLFHVARACSYASAFGLSAGLGLGFALIVRVSAAQRRTAAHLAARAQARKEEEDGLVIDPPLPPIRRPPRARPESVFIELERKLAASRRARRRAAKRKASTERERTVP